MRLTTILLFCILLSSSLVPALIEQPAAEVTIHATIMPTDTYEAKYNLTTIDLTPDKEKESFIPVILNWLRFWN